MCLGDLQMTPEEMNMFDIGELMVKYKGYKSKIDYQYRLSWEQTRWLAFVNLQPHTSKSNALKITDLIKFPWDDNFKQRELTSKDFAEMDFMDRIVKGEGNFKKDIV
jgi:hypothetical protein